MKDTELKVFNQYLIAIIANGISFTTGLSFSWTSPIKVQITEDEEGCPNDFCVTDTEFTWITTCMPIGSLLFSITAGPLMSKYGRRTPLLGFFLISIAGWMFLTFARTGWMLFAGRLLVGAAFGGSGPIVPVYIGEIAHSSIRGRLVSLVEVNIQLGMLVTYVIGQYCAMFLQNLISLGLMSIFFVPLLFIPESPAVLMANGKIEKTEIVLRWLRGKHYDIAHEVKEIVEFQSGQKSEGLKVLFTKRTNIKALVICLTLFGSFHFCGFEIISFYSADIFKAASSSLDPNTASVGIGVACLLGSIVVLFLVDRLGRKFLLVISFFMMLVCCITMGTYFHLKVMDPEVVANLEILPLVVLCCFMFTYCIGVASVPWIIVGEIFAENVKNAASTLSLVWCQVAAVIVNAVIPIITKNYGLSTSFFIFAGSSFFSLVFVLLLLPETKGKTFIGIQELLAKKK